MENKLYQFALDHKLFKVAYGRDKNSYKVLDLDFEEFIQSAIVYMLEDKVHLKVNYTNEKMACQYILNSLDLFRMKELEKFNQVRKIPKNKLTGDAVLSYLPAPELEDFTDLDHWRQQLIEFSIDNPRFSDFIQVIRKNNFNLKKAGEQLKLKRKTVYERIRYIRKLIKEQEKKNL